MDLLDLLRQQRTAYTRTAAGEKLIRNQVLYNAFEKDIEEMQRKIGAQNKKIMIAEMKRNGCWDGCFKRSCAKYKNHRCGL